MMLWRQLLLKEYDSPTEWALVEYILGLERQSFQRLKSMKNRELLDMDPNSLIYALEVSFLMEDNLLNKLIQLALSEISSGNENVLPTLSFIAPYMYKCGDENKAIGLTKKFENYVENLDKDEMWDLVDKFITFSHLFVYDRALDVFDIEILGNEYVISANLSKLIDYSPFIVPPKEMLIKVYRYVMERPTEMSVIAPPLVIKLYDAKLIPQAKRIFISSLKKAILHAKNLDDKAIETLGKLACVAYYTKIIDPLKIFRLFKSYMLEIHGYVMSEYGDFLVDLLNIEESLYRYIEKLAVLTKENKYLEIAEETYKITTKWIETYEFDRDHSMAQIYSIYDESRSIGLLFNSWIKFIRHLRYSGFKAYDIDFVTERFAETIGKCYALTKNRFYTYLLIDIIKNPACLPIASTGRLARVMLQSIIDTARKYIIYDEYIEKEAY